MMARLLPHTLIQRMIQFFTPQRMLILFTFINIINYMDRYVAPGANESIENFISKDLHKESVDAQFGVLQSVFIAGYGSASAIFGHLTHHYPPFRLMSIGLVVWSLAALLSGLAPHYWVLVFARCFSGVGEAAFQCVVPPFIDDNAPAKSRTLWLSVFFSAIPIGSALGFGWGSLWALISWRLAFFTEIGLMLPAIAICWFLPYHRKSRSEVVSHGRTITTPEHAKLHPESEVDDTFDAVWTDSTEDQQLLSSATNRKPVGCSYSTVSSVSAAKDEQSADLNEHPTEGAEEKAHEQEKVPFRKEFLDVVSQPSYLCTVFGYASYTAVTSGFASFGPELLVGMGMFSTQAKASITFGGIVALTGFLSAPVGGILVDKMFSRLLHKEQTRQKHGGNHDLAAPLLNTSNNTNKSRPNSLVEMTTTISPKENNDHRQSTSSNEHTSNTQRNDTVIDYEQDQEPYNANDPVQESESTTLRMRDLKLLSATPQIFLWALSGAILCGAASLLANSSAAFFGLLSLGCFCLFASSSGVNVAIMASVPPVTRPFAIGLGTVIQHGIGDVPSPIAIGALADYLSPKHKIEGTDKFTRSKFGLQMTLLLTTCWLVWCVLFWGTAALLARRARNRHIRTDAYRADEADISLHKTHMPSSTA